MSALVGRFEAAEDKTTLIELIERATFGDIPPRFKNEHDHHLYYWRPQPGGPEADGTGRWLLDDEYNPDTSACWFSIESANGLYNIQPTRVRGLHA